MNIFELVSAVSFVSVAINIYSHHIESLKRHLRVASMGLKQINSFQGVSFDGRLIV